MRSATPSMGSLKPIHLRFGASVVLLSTPRGAARFLRWRVSQIVGSGRRTGRNSASPGRWRVLFVPGAIRRSVEVAEPVHRVALTGCDLDQVGKGFVDRDRVYLGQV